MTLEGPHFGDEKIMVLLDNRWLGKEPHPFWRGQFIVNLRHPNRDISTCENPDLELRKRLGPAMQLAVDT